MVRPSGTAVAAGAKLSTHLGNGIAAQLPRHPNPIWHQAADDALCASLIADGHHLDCATLRVLARAKGPERVILISDASPLAGLPVGTYGPWEVDPSGKIVVAGTPYLAGSNQSLAIGIGNLLAAVSWPIAQVLGTVTSQPGTLARAFASRARTGPTREPRHLSPWGTGRVHPDAHAGGRGLARSGRVRAEGHAGRRPRLPGRPWRSSADRASIAVERQTRCVVSFREPRDRGRLPSTAYLDFSNSSVAPGPPTMEKKPPGGRRDNLGQVGLVQEGSRYLVIRRFPRDPCR